MTRTRGARLLQTALWRWWWENKPAVVEMLKWGQPPSAVRRAKLDAFLTKTGRTKPSYAPASCDFASFVVYDLTTSLAGLVLSASRSLDASFFWRRI
jgi:hypothetical protein